MTEVEMTIPFTPPSVNHYWLKRRGTNSRYVSKEGIAFKQAILLMAKGRTIAPQTKQGQLKVRYALWVRVVLGVKERGDADNFLKPIGDGLVNAGVIHSDARIKVLHIEMDDEDRQNPRTEICVQVIT